MLLLRSSSGNWLFRPLPLPSIGRIKELTLLFSRPPYISYRSSLTAFSSPSCRCLFWDGRSMNLRSLSPSQCTWVRSNWQGVRFQATRTITPINSTVREAQWPTRCATSFF